MICIFNLNGLHLPLSAQHKRQSFWFLFLRHRADFELIIVSKRELMSPILITNYGYELTENAMNGPIMAMN